MPAAGPDDTQVRLATFEELARTGRAPSASQIASRFPGASEADIRAAWERLATGRAIVLQPASRDILLAAPFSAVPAPFVAHARGMSYFAACIWDGLGVLAMLDPNGSVETSCGCCGERMVIEPSAGDGKHAVHFPVPARHWWDDIVFT